jgi:hypothetical protein
MQSNSLDWNRLPTELNWTATRKNFNGIKKARINADDKILERLAHQEEKLKNKAS